MGASAVATRETKPLLDRWAGSQRAPVKPKGKKIPTDPKRDTDSAENLPGGGATLRTFAKEPGLFRDALAPARESENSPATFNPKTATLPAPWNKVPG